jgi:hypothetical protein
MELEQQGVMGGMLLEDESEVEVVTATADTPGSA